jgi:hypothetical protein
MPFTDEQLNDIAASSKRRYEVQMREQMRILDELIRAKLMEGYQLEDLELHVDHFTRYAWVNVITADEKWCRWLEQNH